MQTTIAKAEDAIQERIDRAVEKSMAEIGQYVKADIAIFEGIPTWRGDLATNIGVEADNDSVKVIFRENYAKRLEEGRDPLVWIPFLDMSGNYTSLGDWASDKLGYSRSELAIYRGMMVNKEHPYVQALITRNLESMRDIVIENIIEEINRA